MAFEMGSKIQISQNAQFCPEQNFGSLGQLTKLITPRLLIISGRANNHWKDGKVIYIFGIQHMVRFLSQQFQI
jgi:hypothetical protein